MSPVSQGPSAVSILRKSQRAAVGSRMNEQDEVIGAIVGKQAQAMVALGDRLLIVKSGFMAGATLGDKATTFPYLNIVSIEENSGMIFAVIEILTAAHSGGRTKGLLEHEQDRRPFQGQQLHTPRQGNPRRSPTATGHVGPGVLFGPVTTGPGKQARGVWISRWPQPLGHRSSG